LILFNTFFFASERVFGCEEAAEERCKEAVADLRRRDESATGLG
jgi:hypothetical protein